MTETLSDGDLMLDEAEFCKTDIPQNLLEQMAQQGDREALAQIIKLPDASAEALRLAFAHVADDLEMLSALAEHPHSDADILLNLADALVALQPRRSKSWLPRKFRRNADADARLGGNILQALRKIVDHEQVTGEVLERIAKSCDADMDTGRLLFALASHPLTTESALRFLYPRQAPSIACHPNAPLDLLDKMSFDDKLCQDVAGNPNASKAILERLALPSYREVGVTHWRVAQNPTLPGHCLRSLATDDADALLLMYVACNPQCPPDLAYRIAENGNRVTRRAIAACPTSPGDALEFLAEADPDVWFEIAENPSATGAVLEKIASEAGSRKILRLSAAEHPNTPERALTLLMMDAVPAVREAAAATMQAKRNESQMSPTGCSAASD